MVCDDCDIGRPANAARRCRLRHVDDYGGFAFAAAMKIIWGFISVDIIFTVPSASDEKQSPMRLPGLPLVKYRIEIASNAAR